MAAAFQEAGHVVEDGVFREGIEYAEFHKKTETAWMAKTGGMTDAVSTGFIQSKPQYLQTLRELELECLCCRGRSPTPFQILRCLPFLVLRNEAVRSILPVSREFKMGIKVYDILISS
jgi:hypothetical protein